jgi:hypothetical protein
MSLFPNIARLSATEKIALPFAAIWVAFGIGGLARAAFDALGLFPPTS